MAWVQVGGGWLDKVKGFHAGEHNSPGRRLSYERVVEPWAVHAGALGGAWLFGAFECQLAHVKSGSISSVPTPDMPSTGSSAKKLRTCPPPHIVCSYLSPRVIGGRGHEGRFQPWCNRHDAYHATTCYMLHMSIFDDILVGIRTFPSRSPPGGPQSWQP